MAATDARPVPLKNTAYRLYLEIRKNDGTLITSWTAADTELSADGAAFADATNEATEIGTSGVGYIDLTSGEMNADSVIVKTTVSNTDALPSVIYLYPEEAGDIRVNVTQFGGTAGTFSGGRPEVNATHWAGTAVGSTTVRADLINIAGAAVSASTAQLGVNVVNFGGAAGTFSGGRPEVNATHMAGGQLTSRAGSNFQGLFHNNDTANLRILDDLAGEDAILADTASILADTAAILSDTGTDGVVVASASKSGYSLAASGLDSVEVETGLNARQALAINAAALAGVLAGAGTTSITIAAAGVPATNRITATVTSAGNRTAVTLSPPA